LGFHYGDMEGVGLHIAVDSQGHATMQSMQTFAHGRDGAREVPIENCTLTEDGRACVFVGLGGHPSYADNFVLRSQFFDKVGDRWRITPEIFIDCSPDKINTPGIPLAWSSLGRLADSNNMVFSASSSPKDFTELQRERVEWSRYNPYLFLTKLYHWIVNLISLHLVHPEIRMEPPANWSTLLETAPAQRATSLGPDIALEQPPLIADEVPVTVIGHNEDATISDALLTRPSGLR